LCIAVPIAAPRMVAPEPELRERPISADEAAIRQVSEDWIRFYSRGDAVSVAVLYTEDSYYLSAHPSAREAGDRGLLGTRERGIKAGGHIDFVKPLTLYYTGDLAYCAGTYQATNAGVTVDGRILISAEESEWQWLMPRTRQ
jgi:ketosteroid isomerase-like protein